MMPVLPNPAEYGKHKPGQDPGWMKNKWLEYQYDTALEFCQMILLANEYHGIDITPYRELIGETVRFFDEHYQYLASRRGATSLTEDGKLVIYPSSGCETYKMAYNPSSVIAALQAVVSTMERHGRRSGSTAPSPHAYPLSRFARYKARRASRLP